MPTVATTRLRRSSRLRLRPTFRIRNSRAYWSVKPPPVFAPKGGQCRLDLLQGYAEGAQGGRVRGHAVLAHLATDRDHLRDAGTDRRRGRTTASAASRSAIGDTPSGAVMATSMT